MWIAALAGLAVAVLAAAGAARAGRVEAARRARAHVARARAEAAAAVTAAGLAASARRTALATEGRAEALTLRATNDEALAAAQAAVERREDAVAREASVLAAQREALEQRAEQLALQDRELQSTRDRASGLERDAQRRRDARRGELEARAEIRLPALIAQLGERWLEDARARAAAALRAVEQTAADPAHDRAARRVMEIAATRFHHHYLTERAMNHLRLGTELIEVMLERDAAIHAALERASGVQLLVNDERTAIRMDGLDGVGKEAVRRAVGRWLKKPETVDEARRDPEAWAAKARDQLAQEIRALGKRAFQTLKLPKAHPEILELVGALNFRTSYTQNQWWHAVEASYLAGMIAAELGLDPQLARRATLLHDIGKALTHKIEGSHAVIGADIARRLGEPEVVANAIGAHHLDEPFQSAYAYLVAAADAMSGGRPGARRELAEGFTAKIEDLERIGASRRGVLHAHAVQGGRELRVYVRERDVDDLRVVELSSEIAAQISDEMTFPGQIKVTVIRAFEATAVAN